MELVYLWVEEYKNIRNQGFNFSPRFECEFKDGVLTINENKDYVSIFPDNINVTAIVGENGSGKSSILEILANGSGKDFLCIFEIQTEGNKVLKYFSKRNIKTDIELIQNFDIFKSKQFIYISMSPFENTIEDEVRNLSIANNKFTADNFNNYQAYTSSLLLTQMDYKNILLKEFSINEPHKLTIIEENKTITLLINSDDFNQYFANDLTNKNMKFEFYEKNNTLIRFSSGQKAILYYLSCFLYIQEKITKDCIVLFDEIELFLHPMWQQKILNIFLRVIEKIPKKMPMHLIIPSHSPFILSDIPKENVIFLEKYKEKDEEVKKAIQGIGNCKNASKDIKLKTFGANIHTLLSNGFFMIDGLMGEFAKSKIEEIKKFYELIQELQKKGKENKELWKKSYKRRKKRFENIQKIIGEPFLKTIIKNYLDELEILFNGKKEFLDKEIKRLQDLQKSLHDKA
ncbi:AAA family ATPase [Arcobacter cloacae]|uniref:ATPase AAA-type core domain-containing protein n=1 Tax=Arcobacter cloacae TaxID=1054034 RepID=A0A4Q0ZBQ9_9BACT|nr:AAA family ATPase [Arcobacter cloacae]RXJ83272.1 hypothetical protein CRU90_10190 [Arcobacter cloacae]